VGFVANFNILLMFYLLVYLSLNAVHVIYIMCAGLYVRVHDM